MDGRAHALPAARALAVRGPLTADLIGLSGPVAFGDPGILAARRMPRPRPRWRLGLVPHGHHRADPFWARLADASAGQVRIVNVHTSAPTAVREIAACAAVFTTSLHGLITADAYGIPARWTTMTPALNGGDFKFRDYEAALTPRSTRYLPFDPTRSVEELVRLARPADPDAVAAMADGLERALAPLRDGAPGVQPLARGILDYLHGGRPAA